MKRLILVQKSLEFAGLEPRTQANSANQPTATIIQFQSNRIFSLVLFSKPEHLVLGPDKNFGLSLSLDISGTWWFFSPFSFFLSISSIHHLKQIFGLRFYLLGSDLTFYWLFCIVRIPCRMLISFFSPTLVHACPHTHTHTHKLTHTRTHTHKVLLSFLFWWNRRNFASRLSDWHVWRLIRYPKMFSSLSLSLSFSLSHTHTNPHSQAHSLTHVLEHKQAHANSDTNQHGQFFNSYRFFLRTTSFLVERYSKSGPFNSCQIKSVVVSTFFI